MGKYLNFFLEFEEFPQTSLLALGREAGISGEIVGIRPQYSAYYSGKSESLENNPRSLPMTLGICLGRRRSLRGMFQGLRP